MKIWTFIQLFFGAAGGAIGAFFGGWDGLLQSLVIFTVIDYITGVLKAIVQKNLSSEIGFKGIIKKVVMFLIVGIVSSADAKLFNLTGIPTIETGGNIFRDIVLGFFLANEGISILENAVMLGVPIPEQLKNILLKIRNKNDTGINDDNKGDE